MARLIPSFSHCSQSMTKGERRLAQRLQTLLEDDYYVWYDVPVGPELLHPDFIILHPGRGLFVLEVKDWSITYIQSANRETFDVLTADGSITKKNPLEQARNYAIALANLLQRDPGLTQRDGRYNGRLICPYGYGVVFPEMTRQQFIKAELDQVIPEHLVICRDEMVESVDPLHFQERIWGMARYDFGCLLSMPQIDRIRWHLFPEIRVGAGSTAPVHSTEENLMPEVVRVMDWQQEQLARSMGEGHRVIHGVSGSGKTMILAYRCMHLAEQYDQPILVLCYNVALATRLRQMMAARRIDHRVRVQNFHSWCGDQLALYHVARPERRGLSTEDYLGQLVQRVINGVDRGQIPRGQYAAVLIDEGHDFEEDWFRLVAQMVDPATNSLLVLYDDAQNLYGRSQRRGFSFASVGIQARGRTTILTLNYRNTQEILSLAYGFAQEMITPQEADEDNVPLVQPEYTERHGPEPELLWQQSFRDEIRYLSRRLRQLHDERGVAWNDMAIVYRSRFMGETLTQQLMQDQVPVEWVNRDSLSRQYHASDPTIKIITMHSSKGLEFPVVAIPGLGYMPNPNESQEAEARLLYVAMTRAIDQLILTYHRRSDFVERLIGSFAKGNGIKSLSSLE